MGSHHPEREELLKQLTEYNLQIQGYRWNEIKKSPVSPYINSAVFKANKTKKGCAEMCEHFNLSKINLNIHHRQAVLGGANLRIFECLATNSFMLSDNHPGLDKLFKIGKELVCYDSVADLKEKIDYYLAHDEERLKIAKAGQERVLKELKIIDRIRILLKVVEQGN